MSIVATYEEDGALFVVEPEYGCRVVFEVSRRRAPVGPRSTWGTQRCESRYVVGLKGSNGNGFSTHVSYEAACKAARIRAQKYERAYSRPRGLVRAS